MKTAAFAARVALGPASLARDVHRTLTDFNNSTIRG